MGRRWNQFRFVADRWSRMPAWVQPGGAGPVARVAGPDRTVQPGRQSLSRASSWRDSRLNL